MKYNLTFILFGLVTSTCLAQPVLHETQRALADTGISATSLLYAGQRASSNSAVFTISGSPTTAKYWDGSVGVKSILPHNSDASLAVNATDVTSTGIIVGAAVFSSGGPLKPSTWAGYAPSTPVDRSSGTNFTSGQFWSTNDSSVAVGEGFNTASGLEEPIVLPSLGGSIAAVGLFNISGSDTATGGVAYDINNSNTIVGSITFSSSGQLPVIWTYDAIHAKWDGAILSNWVSGSHGHGFAKSINDRGQIGGTQTDGTHQMFVLIGTTYSLPTNVTDNSDSGSQGGNNLIYPQTFLGAGPSGLPYLFGGNGMTSDPRSTIPFVYDIQGIHAPASKVIIAASKVDFADWPSSEQFLCLADGHVQVSTPSATITYKPPTSSEQALGTILSGDFYDLSLYDGSVMKLVRPSIYQDSTYPINITFKGNITTPNNYLCFRTSLFMEDTGVFQVAVDMWDWTPITGGWKQVTTGTLLQNCNKTFDVYVSSGFAAFIDSGNSNAVKARLRIGPVLTQNSQSFTVDVDQARWIYTTG